MDKMSDLEYARPHSRPGTLSREERKAQRWVLKMIQHYLRRIPITLIIVCLTCGWLVWRLDEDLREKVEEKWRLKRILKHPIDEVSIGASAK
jgi:hypothetical protein